MRVTPLHHHQLFPSVEDASSHGDEVSMFRSRYQGLRYKLHVSIHPLHVYKLHHLFPPGHSLQQPLQTTARHAQPIGNNSNVCLHSLYNIDKNKFETFI